MASRSSIFSLKAAAVAAGVAAAGTALHCAVPWTAAFLLSEGPRMYGALHSWLAPPYLYFVVNGIIISIAAASRFQKAEDAEVIAGSAVSEQDPAVVQPEFESNIVEYESKIEEQSTPPIGFTAATEEYQCAVKVEEVEGEGVDEFVISRSSWSPKRRDSTEISPEYSSVPEKPLVSVRFGHRKSIKASPEGRALRVARPKRNETLESTWKAITDGRAVPLARHLKKSDTWGDMHCRVRDDEAVAVMRKCETLNDRVGRPLLSPAGTPGKLKRDPSLGQDDLNRRVEAFIKKFNEEMRLQRQESFKQYKDMINKGSG